MKWLSASKRCSDRKGTGEKNNESGQAHLSMVEWTLRPREEDQNDRNISHVIFE
jgi:hypothetical protein